MSMTLSMKSSHNLRPFWSTAAEIHRYAYHISFMELDFKLLKISQVERDAAKELDEEERNRSLRLLKTVSQWLAGMWSRTYGCQPDVQLLFLPYLCSHESSDTDKELARECSLALCFIAQTVLRPSAIDIALKTVHQVAQNGTWKARIASLEFLQVRIASSSRNRNLKRINVKLI